MVPFAGRLYLVRTIPAGLRDVALSAVESGGRVFDVFHEPFADSAARERFARIDEERELGFEQGVHFLEAEIGGGKRTAMCSLK